MGHQRRDMFLWLLKWTIIKPVNYIITQIKVFMKKIFVALLFFASCTSSYNKADQALEGMKMEQRIADSLLNIIDYNVAITKASIDPNPNKYNVSPDGKKFFREEYLASIADTAEQRRVRELNKHMVNYLYHHIQYKDAIPGVTNEEQKLELIKKFDRIYVLGIEK